MPAIKLIFLLAVTIAVSSGTYTQTIQYSRQQVKHGFPDKIELIPNVGTNHHVLLMTINENPSIYIFDQQLQIVEKRAVPLKLEKNPDIRIIPFKNFYFLYLHNQWSRQHQLWKINSAGDATSLTEEFQSFIDSTFKNNNSTLQLLNKNEHLVVVANKYYPDLKKMITSVIQVDKNFKTASVEKVFIPFDRTVNGLRQVVLADDNILFLKTSRDSLNYSMEVVKANLRTGELLQNGFHSNTRFNPDASLKYIPEDSSILLYSTILSEVLISRLDHQLNEMEPMALLKRQFSNGVSTNFIFLNGERQFCLGINRNARRLAREEVRIPNVDYNLNTFQRGGETFEQYSQSLLRNGGTNYNTNRYTNTPVRRIYVNPADEENAIRFSVYGQGFRLLNDSVVTNKKSRTVLNGREYSTVLMGKKSYLIVKQDYPGSKNGLLLATVNCDNYITTNDITINEKYNYLLPNLKTINNEYVLLPYLDKSELGLVKIAIAKMER